MTFNNPLNVCFSNKKFILYVKSKKKLYENRYYMLVISQLIRINSLNYLVAWI